MTDTQDKMSGRLVLGRYRVLRPLAQGGMGAVYLARVEGAAGFAKPVVVKLMLPHLSTANDKKAQFVREAQILSHLRHPGIVNVLDFGKHEHAHVMVLEYVHGYNLGQWLKYCTRTGRRMPWETAVYVVLQVLLALNYAHTFTHSDGSRAEIIHRDISPGNILIDIDGSVRLVDFGIARMEVGQAAQELSGEGVFKGKLPYAAPELFSNEKATPSTDIYACGVVLYQVLSGANPFTAQDASSILRRVMSLVPAAISTLRDDIPPDLDKVLAKALEKQASSRYSSAAELAASLRALLVHSEAEVALEVMEKVREDFLGDMARLLELQSLGELEDTWRSANAVRDLPTNSSMPPTVQVSFSPGLMQKFETITVPTPTEIVRSNPATNRQLVFAVGAAAILVGGIAVTTVSLTRWPTHAPEPRFMVVEAGNSHNDGATDRPSTTGSDVPPATAGTAQDGAPSPSASTNANRNSKPLRIDPNAADSSNGLSRVFARRQGSIQACFQANASGVSGAPELSIRFAIDAGGKVTSATVRPATVASTELGRCLEGVARSTEFGVRDKPLVFSIPITARAR